MLTTYPMNDRDYGAEDAELFHCTRNSGVFDGGDFACSVTGADNAVTVGAGIAWIRNAKFKGRVAALRAAMTLDMGVANATYPRIDAVVLRFEPNVGTSLVIKNGTAATNPAPPEVTQTEAVYELHLYHVRREAGAAAIPVGALTDLRADRKYCGLMQDDVTPRDANITADKLPVVPVAKGGTGAQDAATARTNLGAAAAKHSHNVSDVSGWSADVMAALLAAGYMRMSGYQIVSSVDAIPSDAPEGAFFLVLVSEV